MLMRKTTTSTVDTVLACDPAVVRANGGAEVESLRVGISVLPPDTPADRLAADRAELEAAKAARDAKLDAFRSTRDMASIVVPADACRITLRPLSAEERLTVGEAGLEVALAAKGSTDAAARAAAIRVARLEAQARCARGVVRAVMVTATEGRVEVTGAELLERLTPSLLYQAIFELSNAIARLSELDPLGKGR